MPTSGAKSPAGRPERIQESRMRRRCWGVSGNRSGAGSATRRLPALPRPANFGTGPLPALGSSAISPTTSGSGSCGVTAAIWAAGNPAVTGSVPRLGSRSGVDSSDMIPSFGKGHPEGIPLLVSAFQAAIIIEGRTALATAAGAQHGVGGAAPGQVDAEQIVQDLRDLAVRQAGLLVEFHHGGLRVGAELAGGGAQGVGSLQGMAALHPPGAAAAATNVDVELA